MFVSEVMKSKEDFLIEELINIQYRCIRLHLVFTGVPFILGIAVIVFANSASEAIIPEGGLKVLYTIGGTFVAVLCTLPGKELVNYWQKANMLRTIKNLIHLAGEAQDIIDDSMNDRINSMLMQSVEKIIVG